MVARLWGGDIYMYNQEYTDVIKLCCILRSLPHRLCKNNIIDVARLVMLHNIMQYIFATGV